MNSPIAHNKSQQQLKPFMAIDDFNRRLDKAVAHRSEGTINYALENFYIGADFIFCIDHAGNDSAVKETT